MDWREFDTAERDILGHAPATFRKLYEVRLKLARERLARGDDVAGELTALRHGLHGFALPRSRRTGRVH